MGNLVLISDYANDDTNIQNMQQTLTQAFKGKYSLSITEGETAVIPNIAAGSWVEINGSLYQAQSESTITDNDPITDAQVADGIVYLVMLPQSDSGGGSAEGALTATEPTWSDSKQGFYLTNPGFENYRGIMKMQKSGDSYTEKEFMVYSFVNNPQVMRVSSSSYYQLTEDAWTARTLGTENNNYIFGASLATNKITLPAGFYKFECFSNFRYSTAAGDAARYCTTRLYNFTASAEIAKGSTVAYEPQAAGVAESRTGVSVLSCFYEITVSTEIIFQYYCTGVNTSFYSTYTSAPGCDANVVITKL